MRGAAAVWLGAVALGCGLINPNIFDTDIRLQRQVYSQDFGRNSGKVPAVPCSGQADTCQQVSSVVQGVPARGVCDPQSMRCQAEASVTLSYPVNLSEDPAFQSGVAGRAVQFVRAAELGYSLPINTLTFDIPEIEIYIGPQNARNKTDPGVVLIGKVGPFTRGQTISDSAPMTLAIADGSPARTQLEQNIKNPKAPFVFLIHAQPRISGGDDVPAGRMELHLFPKITVGLPR